MNWTIILIETVGYIVLFTAMVVIPAIKNPASGIHNYPPEIQEEYFKTHARVPTAPLSKRTILIKFMGILIFSIMLTGGAPLAGAEGFADGFGYSVLLFAVAGAYDTLFIDWMLFAKMKVFRLPGTEHMDREYAQKWFHVKGILFPGSLYAVILGQIVGGAVALVQGR